MTKMKAVNTLRIKKGKADEVLKLFEKPKSVRTFDGFILMEVIKTEDTEEYDELKICTTWKDDYFFEFWRESSADRKAHAATEEGTHEKNDSREHTTVLLSYIIRYLQNNDK